MIIAYTHASLLSCSLNKIEFNFNKDGVSKFYTLSLWFYLHLTSSSDSSPSPQLGLLLHFNELAMQCPDFLHENPAHSSPV